MLEVGTKAPEFSLPDQNGNVHTLEEYRGKKVILYFYPKDNTPAAPNRPAALASYIPSLWKRVQWCWASARTAWHLINGSRKNMACRLRCCQTRNFPASRHTMCGRKRRCMEKSAWAWCGRPISSMRMASLKKLTTR